MPKPDNYKAHVSQQKKQVVAEFVKLIDDYPIIGAVDVENMPALQLNRMREQLRGTVHILMTKKRLLRIALEQSKKDNVTELIGHFKGMPALLFSKESPFKLYKILKKNKSKAPIKAGQVAPNDIVVPAGKTNFAPGPVIGELGSLGIKTKIEDGKIAITADSVVAKEGEVVKEKLASILTRLGIEPMEIGLNLTAVWENGGILTKDILDVDEDAYVRDLQTAASWAFNLAVNAGYPTAETIQPMLSKAHTDAYALAVAQDIMTEQTKELILAKAEAQAQAVKKNVPDAPARAESKEESEAENSAEESSESTTAPEGETKEE